MRRHAPDDVAAKAALGRVEVRSSKDSRIDHMTLRLAKGDVFLVAVEKAYAVHSDPAKCRATALGRGTFTITGGTRSFAGARGAGTYIRNGVLYGTRTAEGACLGQKGPIAKSSVRVTMAGAVSLG